MTRFGRFLVLLCAAWLLFGCKAARADDCSASATDIAFGQVSPVAGSDYYASGSVTVTCTWSPITGLLNGTSAVLLPNATICVNLGLGSVSSGGNRAMSNGGATLQYELYRDSTYAAGSVWGGGAGMPASASGVSTVLAGLLALGSQSTTIPVYARIPAAALAGAAPTGGQAVASFAGSASISYAFSTLLTAPCTGGKTASFTFQVTATVINDCLIGASPLSFGNQGVLNAAARSTTVLSVKCSNGTAYQVALNGGSNGSLQAGRQMLNTNTGEKIGYRVSRTLDGTVWGDGSNGTDILSGTGTGAAQAVNVYGSVPKQATPSPGNYQDRITATLVF